LISVGLLVVLILALVGAGWTLLGRVDIAGRVRGGERWLAAYSIGALLVYFLVFFSGFFVFSKASAIAVVLVAVAFAAPSIPAVARDLQRSCSAGAAALRDPWLLVIWAAIVVSMLAMLVQAFAPPNDYDSLNYHLAIPRNDLEQGVIAPHWYKGVFSFFPALGEHQVRIALAIAGEGAAQATTWMFGVFLVLGTVLLLRRAGSGPGIVALAVLMLISVRAVVWEMATCYVEIQLAVFILFAYLAYDKWRNGGGDIWGGLFGVALAGGVLVKYHGLVVPFCFLPLIITDLIKGRIKISALIGVAGLCLLLLLPHLIRNFAYTGNPAFPIINGLFNPDSRTFFSVDDDPFGRSRTVLNYARILWDISILPTHLFDGAMIGAPYLLIFAPFACFGPRERILPMAVVFFSYLAFWHWGMTRQVRFLIPVFPFLAAFSAIGAARLWRAMTRRTRPILAIAGSLLLINQLLFVGIYALLRIPPAVGLVSAEDYHARTPTMNGAYYGACRYIESRLVKGDSYISMLEPHSYYCPQSSAIIAPAFPEEARRYWLTGAPLKELSGTELAAEMERRHVKFVVIETSREFRFGPSSAPTVVESDYASNPMKRMGKHLQPALKTLKPVFEDHNSSVYDAKEIVQMLRKISLKQ
jgi:hypothetical protein